MSSDDRVANLEKELTEIKQALGKFGQLYEREAGEAEAFRGAITALIAAHPDPDLLAEQIRQHVARPEAASVFAQVTEERLVGLQSAQDYLADVCSTAQRLHRIPR